MNAQELQKALSEIPHGATSRPSMFADIVREAMQDTPASDAAKQFKAIIAETDKDFAEGRALERIY